MAEGERYDRSRGILASWRIGACRGTVITRTIHMLDQLASDGLRDARHLSMGPGNIWLCVDPVRQQNHRTISLPAMTERS